jgi:hypothetical protein
MANFHLLAIIRRIKIGALIHNIHLILESNREKRKYRMRWWVYAQQQGREPLRVYYQIIKHNQTPQRA